MWWGLRHVYFCDIFNTIEQIKGMNEFQRYQIKAALL